MAHRNFVFNAFVTSNGKQTEINHYKCTYAKVWIPRKRHLRALVRWSFTFFKLSNSIFWTGGADLLCQEIRLLNLWLWMHYIRLFRSPKPVKHPFLKFVSYFLCHFLTYRRINHIQVNFIPYWSLISIYFYANLQWFSIYEAARLRAIDFV